MRRLVKRILRRYGYPPDKQESATRHRHPAGRTVEQEVGGSLAPDVGAIPKA